MEHFISLEIWAIMVAAPCIISWFLGEMYGAARVRKLMEGSGPDDDHLATVAAPASADCEAERTLIFGPRDVMVPAPGAPYDSERYADRSAGIPEPVGCNPRAKEHVATKSMQRSADPIQSRRRREAFDGMPSVAELHAQAQRIRESDAVWDDPDLKGSLRETDPISARVLQHYVGSINELARCNARLENDCASPLRRADDDSIDVLPRFAGAAPMDLDQKNEELFI